MIHTVDILQTFFIVLRNFFLQRCCPTIFWPLYFLIRSWWIWKLLLLGMSWVIFLWLRPNIPFTSSFLCLDYNVLRCVCFGLIWSFLHLSYLDKFQVSWIWKCMSFTRFGKFSVISSSSIFSAPFFPSSFSETSITCIWDLLVLSYRSRRLCSFFFQSFFLFLLHIG